MATIFRYTEAVQAKIRSKTKPEPWMHVAFSKRSAGEKGIADYVYCIFVWDTRKFIEEGGIALRGKNTAERFAGFVHAKDPGGAIQGLPNKRFMPWDM